MLGPPVCKPCMKVMRYNKEYPYWTCSECNKNAHKDEGVTHLFCLTDAELEEMDRIWGTNQVKRRQQSREIMNG